VSDKSAALAEIVEIAQRNALSVDDIVDALGGTGTTQTGRGSARRMLAYIGGIFVFAGIAVYIAMFWEDMNSAARIIITLGSGQVALVLALVMIGRRPGARAVTPLLLVAAWLQPTGVLVAFDELGSGGDIQKAALAITAVMLAQGLLLLRRYPRPALVFLALVFGVLSAWNTLDLLGMDEDLNVVVTGLSLLLVTYGLDKTAHRVITPFWYFLGGASFLGAMFHLLENTSIHILYLGVTAFMIYASTLARSRPLLFCSTLAMMGYLGYFTGEYFVDSVGWPIALILMGLVLIGLSNLALRISRKYIAD
jgi:hypothetical protein